MVQAEMSAPAVSSSRARGAGLIIAICFMVSMLEGFDIQAIGLVGANLAKVAGLDKEQLGFVFAMANVGLVLGAAIGGWLADKVGRKPIFLAAVITFGLFTLATMFATELQFSAGGARRGGSRPRRRDGQYGRDCNRSRAAGPAREHCNRGILRLSRRRRHFGDLHRQPAGAI